MHGHIYKVPQNMTGIFGIILYNFFLFKFITNDQIATTKELEKEEKRMKVEKTLLDVRKK